MYKVTMLALALGVVMVPSAFAQTKIGETCSGQHGMCTAYCSANSSRSMCNRDCENRMKMCMETGTYTWLNRPNAMNLEKK